jgi:hypothetical protein
MNQIVKPKLVFDQAPARSDEIYPSSQQPLAPSRDEIGEIADPALLHSLLSDVMDVVISIETQLEFYPDEDDLRSRRVGALIYWRIAAKNIKNRLSQMAAERSRGARQSSE